MKATKQREATPGEELSRLRSALGAERGPRAVLLRGDERYFRTSAADRLLAWAKPRPWEVARHDAEDPDFSLRGLVDDLLSPSMFASERAVFVRAAARLCKKEGSQHSEFTRAALAFLEDKSIGGMLVIDAEGLRADHALTKAVSEAGGLVLSLRRLWDSPPPWDPDPRKTELVQWTMGRARELSLPLTLDEALYISAATGNDLFAIDTQLERVAHRGKESVRSLVPWNSGASPFAVCDALLSGDAARSLSGLEALFKGGFQGKDGERETDAAALQAILLSTLRARAARTLAVALDARNLESVANPRERTELEARAKLRPVARWRSLHEDALELERRTRTPAGLDIHDLVAFALRHKLARSGGAR